MDYPNPERLLEKRARLELLFCGFVRPYKGLDILLEALLLLDGKDICLTIVGEWWTKDIKLLTLLKKLKEKVEVIDRYVEEEELARYFYRADLVVLPYRDASGTGIIPMAYYYKKPVIATLVGGLPDFVEEGLSGSLVKPEDSFALAEVILEFYNRSPLVMEEGIKKVIKNKNMNWENFCETVIKGLKDMEEKGIK
jgi:glycosyltransferase involved in cell wall biosynthesis